MAEQHDRILGYFLEEASEHLSTIEQGLRKLPETVRQPTMIRELFRAAHSIKGSAAMLGLLDIQKIGNQFEANFRMLKEHPHIAVDSQLQSLFLESFSFLQAGIKEVKASSDPYRQDPNSADPIGDPVFEELKAYLQHLLVAAKSAPLAPANQERDFERDPAIEQVFGEYVSRKLDEIISLCLQTDRPELRTQIQQICQKLGNLGENFEFLEWTNLFTACRLAIANPANFLPQLGETMSIAVKQAQALVLADRHHEIAVTPDLEALILSGTLPVTNRVDSPQVTLRERHATETTTGTTASLPLNGSNLSTIQLDRDETTQKLPQLASIHDGSVMPLANSGFGGDMTLSGGEFDADAMELNEFMNLLSDEMPTEGTWMQEDDLLDRDIPLPELGHPATDAFYSQMFQPIMSTPSIDEIPGDNTAKVPDLSLETYDEETFYTPDLEGIDDRDLPLFWAESELAIAPQQSIYPLDLLDPVDLQLQPISPAPDFANTPTDFGLDHPISDLFPTVTPDLGTDFEDLPAVSNDVAASDKSIFDVDEFYLNGLSVTESLDETPFELETPVSTNNLQGNPQIPAIALADSNLTNITNSQYPKTADLDRSGGDISSTSDVLCLEELNASRFPESTAEPDQIAAKLTDWIDSSNDLHNVDDFADLDLNSLSIESVANLVTGDDLEGLDITNLTASDLEINEGIADDFAGFDFTPISNHNSTDLGLDFLNINEPLVNLTAEPTVDTNSVTNSLIPQTGGSADDLDFTDLDFSQNSNDLADFDELELNSSIGNMFADLDLDFSENSQPVVAEASADCSSDSQQQQDLAGLNLSSVHEDPLDGNLSNPSVKDLDLEAIDRANDLDILNHIESSIGNNFGDFDHNVLSADDLDSDRYPASNLEDLSELNFDLDNLSSELASQELTDLDSMLGNVPDANLSDIGNLDELLGITAVSIGSIASIASNLELDDLDALVAANPEQITPPVANFDDLDGLLVTPVPPVVSPPTQAAKREPKERRAKQSRTFEQTMRVSVSHLNNLNNLVGELVVNRNTLEQDQNRMRQFVEKLLSEVQKLNEVGKRMQDLYERSLMENSLVASRQQYKPATTNPQISGGDLDNGALMEYDPLEMDRFTPIHLLSQKMIELTVRVRESTADIEFVVDGSTEVTRTLRQITGQLQEDLTKSRMVPFAQTADRLQRGVRDNALKYGKHVELSVEGRDTLIDKVILESLNDPLVHMVNNAIAHGIEPTETRLAAGKPSEGKITIRALHQGNQTIISISDDGAGIDPDRVKHKGIEKGIITAQQAATMSKNEVYDLLFLPSFSTKDQADELSGRGVGMDVVKTSITDIRGTIATESQLGFGTTFTIRLPLALSIAKALIAVNNKSNIAFPMDGIEDTQDISPEQIQTNSEGQECIFWRDELMPFKPLSDLLGFNRPLARNNFYSTHEEDTDLVSILILRSDGNFTAVKVDKITGDQEIVIKPLQGPAAKPLGIAGATVMGDGRIIPIADVMELIALANGTLARHVSTQWTAQMTIPTLEVRESMVLIVDDSITVRELLSLTFKRAGYRVEQARDGQEAWDKLRAGLPCDIVFCDIEMPRMDGLEFLSRIQKDNALKKVPVAMLTSRGSDRHRQIASQLGASGYFIKPYLEEALLDAAKRMIKGEVLEII